MKKRLLSLLLALVMVLSLLPFSAFAENEGNSAPAKTDETGILGDGSMGTLLADDVSAAGASNDTDDRISELEISGNTATVSYDTASEEANIVVGIFDEESQLMLASGTAPVSGEDGTAEVTIEGDIPECYVAKAYMLDAESNEPLCSSYMTETHTAEMQVFAAGASQTKAEKADIVFVIDSTGSMYDEIYNVISNLNSFTETLKNAGVDFRISVVDYKDIEEDGEYSTRIVEYDNQIWLTSNEQVESVLSSIDVDGGGDNPETVLDAMGCALTLDFRRDADKFAFLLTDADYKTVNRYGYYDMEDLIDGLNEEGMSVSVIAPTSYQDTYMSLYSETDGIFCNIYGDFADELFKLAEFVKETVESIPVTYEISDAYANKTKRTAQQDFYYTDDFFEADSSDYNHDLALMSLGMTMASVNNANKGNIYIDQLMHDIDCDEVEVSDADAYKDITKTGDKCEFTYGLKALDNGEYLVPFVIRSCNYGGEWASNCRVFGSAVPNYSQGFKLAADGAYNKLAEYIFELNKRGIDSSKINVWVMGFSRGGAVSNLIGADLNENLAKTGLSKENIFVYTFATPNTVKASIAKSYSNIHNIVSQIDIVPRVPLATSGWNYTKYGVTHYLPCHTTAGKNYRKLLARMRTQFNRIMSAQDTEYISYEPFDGQELSIDLLIDYLDDVIKTASYYSSSGTQGMLVAFLKDRYAGTGKITLEDLIYYAFKDYNKTAKNLVALLNDYDSMRKLEFVARCQLLGAELNYIIAIPNDAPVKAVAKMLLNFLGAYAARIVATDCINKNYTSTYDNAIEMIAGVYYMGRNSDLLMQHWPEEYLAWMRSGDENTVFTTKDYKHTSVKCPVDVTVYDADGNVVARIVDDEVDTSIEDCLLVTVDEYGEKGIYMPNDEEYRIEVTAREDGKVDIISETCNIEGETISTECYVDQPMTQDQLFVVEETPEGTTVQTESEVLDADCSTSGEISTFEITAEESNGGTVFGTGSYQMGESVRLVSDADDGYRFVAWYENGEQISTDEVLCFSAIENRTVSAEFEEHTHDWTVLEEKEATDSESGYIIYGCTGCSKVDYKEIIVEPEATVNIITQPVDYAGNDGDTAYFEVVAEGDGLTYQWYYSNDGGNKWSKTSATGAKTSVLEPDLKLTTTGRMFKCEIIDANGEKVTTDVVKMYLAYSDIVITKQPENYLGKANDLPEFTVEAEGTNLKYQWQYSADGGETWSKSSNEGNTTETVKVRLYEYRDGYLYRCMIMSGRGDDSVVVYSEPATLNKIPATVNIVKHPKNAYCATGETAVFTVGATGDGLEYQWQYSTNGGETWGNSGMTGAKTDTLNVKAIASRNGQIYRCKVTDESGTSKYTVSVTLNIGAKAVISSQPESYTGPVNSNAVFSVTATGDGLSYQWYYRQSENGNWVKSGQANAQTDTLTIAVKSSRNGYQYRCEITNAAGMVTTSDIATLTVGEPAHVHSYGEWQTVTAATCTEDGEERCYCEGCSEYQSRIIPATGHSYVDGYCENCGMAEGDTVIASGTCEDNVSWEIYGYGLMKVYLTDDEKTGRITDFASAEDSPWHEFVGIIKTVEISSGITSIGKYAFADCENLKRVELPESLVSMGNDIFHDCKYLSEISLPSGIDRIPSYAFYGCTRLKSIIIPDGVAKIGECAFYKSGLTAIELPDSVTSIGVSAFGNCKFDSIVLSDNILEIGTSAFRDCTKLTEATLNCKITSLPRSLFEGCNNLTAVHVKNSIGKIDSSVFNGCAKLSDVYYDGLESSWARVSVDAKNEPLDNATIHYNEDCAVVACGVDSNGNISWELDFDGTLTFTVINSEKVANIPSIAHNVETEPWCKYDDQIKSVVIADGISIIGIGAFAGCYNLENVVIPESVTKICSYAFELCDRLESIELPSGLKSIGNSAFDGCNNLSSVEFAGTERQWTAIIVGSNNDCLLCATIHCAR